MFVILECTSLHVTVACKKNVASGSSGKENLK